MLEDPAGWQIRELLFLTINCAVYFLKSYLVNYNQLKIKKMETSKLNESTKTEKLQKCIDECLACAVACERCATHGIAHADKMLVECIAFCRDCADICTLCARLEARDSSYYKKLCKLCADICNACAEHCEMHAKHHESFRKTGEACRKCAAICAELSE